MPTLREISIRSEHEIPYVRQLTQQLCLFARLSIGDQARLTTAVSQVAQALFLHCRSVRVRFETSEEAGRMWVRVVLEEQPLHESDPPLRGSRLAREDLQKWLDGIRSIVTAFETRTDHGAPVRVIAAKPFPPWQKEVSENVLQEWTSDLENEAHHDPVDAILQQNRELVSVLDELREKDAALEKKIGEIEALEQMRDDLVHALVHDLRNPLASIRTSLSGLLGQSHTSLSDYQRSMIEISYQGAIKLTRMVDDILEVYQLERDRIQIEPVLFDLGMLVDRTLKLQSPLLKEKQIRVDLHIPDYLPLVDGDPALVERVFQNLLDNAIKFTPANGVIEVSAAAHADGMLQFEADQRFLLVRIKDSGPGIPESVRPGLFEKFTAGREKDSGSGLGLAFCKLALQAHGGDIWINREATAGTEFQFLLPASHITTIPGGVLNV